MNYTEYLRQVEDAKQSRTVEDFYNDCEYLPNCRYNAETLVVWVRIIFAAANNDWRELVNAVTENFDGFRTSSGFARYFGLPYKSFRQWVEKRREPPVYIIQLVGYAMINELPIEENFHDTQNT